ncbi:MAG: WD40/YVTN/BNR-like repeat-containing protein [Myxococcota bacterium]
MMRLSLRTALGAALVGLILAALASGCTEERTRMQLEATSLPEGGTVATIAVVEPAAGEPSQDEEPSTSGSTLVAPTSAGLYVQRDGAETWRHIRPSWPESVTDANEEPLSALVQPSRGTTFPASQRFVGQDGHLWLLWRAPGDARPELFTSNDAGQTWRTTNLPIAPATTDDESEADAEASTPSSAEEPSTSKVTHQSANTSFRLLDHDELGLFLVMPREVWRAPSDLDEPIERDDWTRIDLSGIDFSTDGEVNQLPSVIRNYAPSSESRPFEVMTVLADQLRVYRRMEDASQWLMVSTLPTVDRQLLDIPGTDELLLVSPTELYRSRDLGERWEPLRMPAGTDELEFTSAEAIVVDDRIVLIAATTSGQIYQSDDLGSSWTSARAADPDRRAITDIADAPSRDAIYASTRGSGVLRSMEAGTNWHIFNTGLHASRPAALHVRDDGNILLGTNAGLFEGAPSEVGSRWTRLHDRSTTALYVEEETGRTYTGTHGGAVVVREPDGTTSTIQTAPFDRSERILVRPRRLRGIQLMPNSIVEIGARDATGEVFAWSHKQGPLESIDSGGTWASMPLNAAFLNAMDKSYISRFVIADDSTMFMLSHSVRGPEIAQTWRSSDDGETWTSIRRLQEPKRALPVHLLPSPVRDDTLYLSHRHRFLRTLDSGQTWRPIPGPWGRANIIAHALRDQTHAMVLETEHVTEFAIATDVDLPEPTFRRLTIDWPNPYKVGREKLRSMDVRDSRVYIATQNDLLSGSLPTGEQQMPDSVAVIITITAVFVLIVVGFLFMSIAFRD